MITGQQLGVNWEAIGVWYALLLLFGMGYNHLIAWTEKHGYLEGYTWLAVVVGVGATLILSMPIVGWINVLCLVLAFACSGIPMSFGAIWRHVTQRKRATDAIRDEAHDAAEKVA